MQEISTSKFHPFREPDWRYKRVLQMVDSLDNPGRSTNRDDIWVRGLRNFILRYRNGNERARQRLEFSNPGLYFAYVIQERADDDYEVAFMIEARLLAQQTSEEIARESHTLPEAIDWYEALFFNVRDRIHSHDWVMKHVLMKAMLQGAARMKNDSDSKFSRDPLAEPHWDASLKFMGYFGGPVMIDFMLSGYRRGVHANSQDDISDWLVDNIAHHVHRRTAMAVPHFEVNKFNVMELLGHHMQLVALQKAAADAGGAQTTFEKNIEQFLTDIPWTVGKEGKKSFEGTPVAQHDDQAAELRDDELLLMSSGEKNPKLSKELMSMKLPAAIVEDQSGQEDPNEQKA
jgi:hypothetical protein